MRALCLYWNISSWSVSVPVLTSCSNYMASHGRHSSRSHACACASGWHLAVGEEDGEPLPSPVSLARAGQGARGDPSPCPPSAHGDVPGRAGWHHREKAIHVLLFDHTAAGTQYPTAQYRIFSSMCQSLGSDVVSPEPGPFIQRERLRCRGAGSWANVFDRLNDGICLRPLPGTAV